MWPMTPLGKPCSLIDDGKFSVLEPVQPAAERADPQRAVVRKMQALDEIGRQPVGFFEPAKISILQTHQAAARRAEPQRARFVLRDGAHVAERLAGNFVEPLQFSVLITQRARRACRSKVRRPQTKAPASANENFPAPAQNQTQSSFCAIQSAAPRAGPDSSRAVRGQRPNVGIANALRRIEIRPTAVLQAIQARAFRADPQRAVRRRQHGEHGTAFPFVRRRNGFKIVRADDHQPRAGAAPQIFFTVFPQRNHPVGRQSVGAVKVQRGRVRLTGKNQPQAVAPTCRPPARRRKFP